MGLTKQETQTLVSLLKKLEWPIDPQVFAVLVGKVVTVPQELIVLNEENCILMHYRNDGEYTGYHHPGTVLRNNETVSEALTRLTKNELRDSQFSKISIKNIGWIEINKGVGEGQNPTRHEISLLWLARVKEFRGHGNFFPLNDLPAETLPHHRLIIQKLRKRLETGEPILGW